MKRGFLRAMAAVFLFTVHPAAAQSVDGSTVMEKVERLKPGEFLWIPQAAPEGPLLLMVNLKTQRAVLYRNGVPIGITTISSGRDGYATPTGVFTILQKDAEHFSNIYENAPMPFMQRLTWGGVALHAGQLPGYRASHGCIRLPLEFAKNLFEITRLGMTVIIASQQALPRILPSQQLSFDQADNPAVQFEWHPERATTGPISILISGAEEKVMVLRNGRIIGSAQVAMEERPRGTQIYMLQSRTGGAYHWIRFNLEPGGKAETASASALRRFHVAPAFKDAVVSILEPGTTIVVTADALSPSRPAATLIEGQ